MACIGLACAGAQVVGVALNQAGAAVAVKAGLSADFKARQNLARGGV